MCVDFTFHAEDYWGLLSISPEPGIRPLKLLKWHIIPFVVTAAARDPWLEAIYQEFQYRGIRSNWGHWGPRYDQLYCCFFLIVKDRPEQHREDKVCEGEDAEDEEEEEEDAEDDKTNYEWMGSCEVGMPLRALSDSGSLVYVKEGSITVPLESFHSCCAETIDPISTRHRLLCSLLR